jgi:hypothetical protein
MVDNLEARRDKLEEHGATAAEIAFLAEQDEDGMCRRVELNVMTSPQLLEFIEGKLDEHGVDKVIPTGIPCSPHRRADRD